MVKFMQYAYFMHLPGIFLLCSHVPGYKVAHLHEGKPTWVPDLDHFADFNFLLCNYLVSTWGPGWSAKVRYHTLSI